MARILVVDDESLIRVLVADVGESLGHEVLTAASIKEGQDLAQRGVDMIVTDHHECREALPEAEAVVSAVAWGNIWFVTRTVWLR